MKQTDGSSVGFVEMWPDRAVNQPRPPARNCDSKIRYETKEEANAAVCEYSNKVLFTTMTSYGCPIHGCYHKGHDRFMSNEEVMGRMLVESKN